MESEECIETGTKCRGVKGLTRLPQTAAKVPERHLRWGTGRFPLRTLESKPQAGLPRPEHRTDKSSHIAPGREKQQDWSLPARDSWKCRHPCKGPTQNISCVATYLGLWQRKCRVDWSCMRIIQDWGHWGWSLEGSHPRFQC